MTNRDEASLPDALDRLYAAVADLIDPAKQLVDGAVLVGPSAYEALLGEIPASASGENFHRGVGRSLPPVWCDAVDLRVTIDSRVKQLQPGGGSTPARLRALAAKRWRPQDAREVREAAEEIAAWVLSIRALIEPERVKHISAPCPACGRRWSYRQSAGELIRTPALALVTESGCRCLECRAFWPPDRYLFLCKLLGLAAPAGVVN